MRAEDHEAAICRGDELRGGGTVEAGELAQRARARVGVIGARFSFPSGRSREDEPSVRAPPGPAKNAALFGKRFKRDLAEQATLVVDLDDREPVSIAADELEAARLREGPGLHVAHDRWRSRTAFERD